MGSGLSLSPNVSSLGTGDAWLVGYAMAACCGTTLPRDKWSEIAALALLLLARARGGNLLLDFFGFFNEPAAVSGIRLKGPGILWHDECCHAVRTLPM